MKPDPTVPVDPPGTFIKEEIEARGWTQRDLAYVLGKKEQELSPILSGKRAITPDMARLLGDAFDVPADFFANLQKQFDLYNAKAPDPAIRLRGQLQAAFPVREMVNRGWFNDDDPSLLALQFERFFEVGSLNEVPKIAFVGAAKKTRYEDDLPGHVAWLYRVRQLARQIDVPEYSGKKLLQSINRLRHLVIEPQEVRRVPSILSECGVRFVIVEALPNAKIDGVCTWLSDNEPVIGLSTFYDRLDNFWFVLRHEIEHVLNDDGKEREFFDDLDSEAADPNNKNLSKEERRANVAGADFCVPTLKMDSFFQRKNPYFSEKDVLTFAGLMCVHPALVVGQLQHRMKRYNYLRKYQVPVRQHITETAISDGWGTVAPANL
jgi:HTH-type transcriptional regulator / antitoxin HigA